jgi:hypothetical protein
VLWLNYKTLQTHGGSAAALQEAEKLLDERLHQALAKLSGNLSSTVRDAQGRMSQVTTDHSITKKGRTFQGFGSPCNSSNSQISSLLPCKQQYKHINH